MRFVVCARMRTPIAPSSDVCFCTRRSHARVFPDTKVTFPMLECPFLHTPYLCARIIGHEVGNLPA